MIRRFDGNVCSDRTDIVIEAFPRSANTYCVAAIRTLSKDQLSIASHMHSAAQFELANRLNKPALLIVREPEGAISSLSIRRPLVKKRRLIKEYISFHKQILPLIAEGKVVVVSFDDLVGDKFLLPEIAKDILSINIECFSVSPEDFDTKVIELVEKMEQQDSGGTIRETHVARPSEARTKIKENVIEELLKEKELMEEAQYIYKFMNNFIGS